MSRATIREIPCLIRIYTMVDKLHLEPHSAFMALNIKNPEVEQLAAEVADMTGETKTEAIRKALLERRGRLDSAQTVEERRKRLLRFLEREVWPKVPEKVLGRKVTKKEREEILGYGREGV